MKETTLRTTVRGFIWRTIVFLTTIILTYFITGNVVSALSVGALEFIAKLILYIGFEKLFSKLVKYGLEGGLPTAKRSLLKGLIWRTFATCSSMTLTYFVTGDIHSAGMFGLIAFPLKLTMFVIYEQIWKKFAWGINTNQITLS